jgi:hypothetical protein
MDKCGRTNRNERRKLTMPKKEEKERIILRQKFQKKELKNRKKD